MKEITNFPFYNILIDNIMNLTNHYKMNLFSKEEDQFEFCILICFNTNKLSLDEFRGLMYQIFKIKIFDYIYNDILVKYQNFNFIFKMIYLEDMEQLFKLKRIYDMCLMIDVRNEFKKDYLIERMNFYQRLKFL